MADAPTVKALTPFSFLESINAGYERGVDLMSTDRAQSDSSDKSSPSSQYSSYMVNRGLSFFNDTILYANEMNRVSTLIPSKMQYDFLRHAIRPRKRFSKWAKKTDIEVEVVDALIKLFSYSRHRAEECLPLLTDEQKKVIIAKVSTGGLQSRGKNK